MNVLVMAGTSDAREIIKCLSKGNVTILATATTRHGTDLALSSGASKILEGRFNSDQLLRIINKNHIQILIDATHPFASLATQNAITASENSGIRYIRFERPQSELPDSELIHKCSSFEEAAHKILEIKKEKKEDALEKNQGGKILHLAGVNTLHHLTKRITPHLVVVRVLPAVYSIEKCFKLGIPHANIVAMEGIFSTKFNRILMEEYQIEIVLTKESGDSGGVTSKIQAALDLNIPVVIVMRPEIKELQGKKVFDDVNCVCDEILSNQEK
ncbi:MAG: precorrin-6A reductase [Methanobacterium sp.]|jgi:precorrin-6A/cobalt-precorrin-6A reductase|nr:precorrin-6A reductase [Methanobacterium sp.]